MKKITAIFLLSLGMVPLFSLSIYLPDETAQGEVLRVLLWDEEAPQGRISCDLEVEGKSYTSGDSFTLYKRGEGNPWVGLIILGVPSTIPTGEGRVKFDFESPLDIPEEDLSESRGVNITSFNFIHEDIPLNTAMSDLRQGADPEKARQWRILYGILTTFNPEDLFLEDRFILPVSADLRRTSFYGDRRSFIYTDGNVSSSIHHGIDFSGIPGTSVEAAGRGRVAFSGVRILTGETLVIEHLPGVYSSYYHLTNRFVEEGEMVEQSQLIGTIGATGLVTGAHLHWEVRVNGISVAPDSLIEASLIDKSAIFSIIESL
ncbi:MAG: M23 family metallopeptidase [Spirochaetales bacterium]|nr:M23 family metallopeptidase [Spirochaetales bacterium]